VADLDVEVGHLDVEIGHLDVEIGPLDVEGPDTAAPRLGGGRGQGELAVGPSFCL
jgi:hypothetical protein